jgi:glycosyltransferase involved in cell wall biosynthesis
LGISDVVCTPYRGEDQSVSGVLTFALAAGCAVAFTPYRYACDVLTDGAGMLSDFGDSAALANSIASLLDPDTAKNARAAARRAGASMGWPIVGAALRAVIDEVVGDFRRGATSRSSAQRHLFTLPSTDPGASRLTRGGQLRVVEP